MTIQAPEQIAMSVIEKSSGIAPGAAEVSDYGIALAAVLADRAQRPAVNLNAFVTEYEAYQGDDVSYFIDAWQAGAWIPSRIAELTAEWEEATGDTASDYMLSEDDWKAGLVDDEAAEIVRLIEYKKEAGL